jgi:hypothetical protein
MYRVYGRREVMGMRFGVSSRSLRDILAAWRRRWYSITLIMERLWRDRHNGYINSDVGISPGLLFDELEMDAMQDLQSRAGAAAGSNCLS